MLENGKISKKIVVKMKKVGSKFCGNKKYAYLCTRQNDKVGNMAP